MQIAIPFAKLRIWEVAVGPIANELMALAVFLVASGQVCIERTDDGFALWPPELHVLRIVLRRQVLAVAEVDATILLVPSPVPRPVEDLQGKLRQVFIPSTELRFLQNEPSRLDAMTRIDGTREIGVNKLSIGSHGLQ